ncbi:hypothetical protein [Reinekea sp.]|jgi:hypothetical protein|uniref:hypothetical protein n=2 Tax=Reinekea sp. TaxID=1970455 RepID=UPI00398964AC
MNKIILAIVFVLFCSVSLQAQAVQKFPNIINATYTVTGNIYRFDVTISSEYDSAQRYADAFRILDEDGVVYGIRELAHDHANEQPFTRSLSGVNIPDPINTLIIEGRDQKYGWGGETFLIKLIDN